MVAKTLQFGIESVCFIFAGKATQVTEETEQKIDKCFCYSFKTPRDLVYSYCRLARNALQCATHTQSLPKTTFFNAMLNDLKFNSSLESSLKKSIRVFVRRKHKENNRK